MNFLDWFKQSGQKHGGNTYGGATFGGNQFGASARQNVTTPATPPPLPAYQQPGQMMNTFGAMASPAMSLPAFQPPGQMMNSYAPMSQYQTPPIAPPDVAANTQMPPQASMPPQMPDATVVPPMPPSVAIGQAPGMGQPSLLASLLASLRNPRGQQDPSWAQNFGNLGDQRAQR